MNLKSKLATVALATTIALGLGTSAMAQTAPPTTGNVTVQITAGTLSYSITGVDLGEVKYAEEDTASTGTIQIQVNGNGNLDGWKLSVQATQDFTYSGNSKNGQAIPAASLSLTGPDAPALVAGQAIDATNGPVATTNTGSLGSATQVITSAAGYGSGSYTQDLGVSLAIPAYSQVGTYTGVVTVSTSAAPTGTN